MYLISWPGFVLYSVAEVQGDAEGGRDISILALKKMYLLLCSVES